MNNHMDVASVFAKNKQQRWRRGNQRFADRSRCFLRCSCGTQAYTGCFIKLVPPKRLQVSDYIVNLVNKCSNGQNLLTG